MTVPAEVSYALVVEHDGSRLHVGPLDIGTALLFVDEHLASQPGWQHRFVRLLTPTEAVAHVAIGRVVDVPPPGTAPESPVRTLFAQLRRAITTDVRNGGLDDPAVRQLLAHLDPHRPLPLYRGDEECLLGECNHPTSPTGPCTQVEPAGSVCTACTPIFSPGGDWGSGPLPECHVSWPCGVVTAVARYYNIAIPTRDGTRPVPHPAPAPDWPHLNTGRCQPSREEDR